MTTAIATADFLSNLPSTEVADLSKYGAENSFLPRVQLYTKGKLIDKGIITPGHYGVPGAGDEVLDLGKSIDVLVFSNRDKALDTTTDPPTAVFDPDDDFYKSVVKRQAASSDSGCMHGPSFLVFERTTAKFYEFFCGGKSARIEAPNIAPFLPVNKAKAKANKVKAHPPIPMTLNAKLIERPNFSWHAPEVSKCSTPIDNLPEMAVIVETLDKFDHPDTNGPEIANEDEAR